MKELYQIKPGYIVREIAGEATIIPIDPDSDIPSGLLSPNGSAKLLWQMFQTPASKNEAVKQLLEEYEVSEEKAREAVDRFVNELMNYRIMKEVE